MDPRITQLVVADRLRDDIRAAEQARQAASLKHPEPQPTARRRFVRRPRTSTIPGR